MKQGWESWAVKRLGMEVRCIQDRGERCYPLRNDSICRQCFDAAKEQEEKRLNDIPPGEVCI